MNNDAPATKPTPRWRHAATLATLLLYLAVAPRQPTPPPTESDPTQQHPTKAGEKTSALPGSGLILAGASIPLLYGLVGLVVVIPYAIHTRNIVVAPGILLLIGCVTYLLVPFSHALAIRRGQETHGRYWEQTGLLLTVFGIYIGLSTQNPADYAFDPIGYSLRAFLHQHGNMPLISAAVTATGLCIAASQVAITQFKAPRITPSSAIP